MKSIHIARILFLFVIILAGCERELHYEQLTDSKEGAFISIPRAHRGVNQIQVFPVAEKRTFTFGVNFGALGLPSHDIAVSIEEDLYALDSVNRIRELNGETRYSRFPRGSYTLDTRDLTIPSGQMSSTPITMTYYPNLFDPDEDYLLALSITKSSGYAVDPSSKTILIAASRREPHRIYVNSSLAYLVAESPNQTERFLFDAGIEITNPFPNDINITVSEDPTVLQTINDERSLQGLSLYEPFPDDAYTLEGTLSIPGGSRTSTQGILTYRPGSFEQNKSYLLPLTITDASGYTVDDHKKTILVRLIQEEKVNTSGWVATESSSHNTSQTVLQLIDGNLETFWHSNYNAPVTQFPHWVSFDMGAPRIVTGVRLHPRHNNDTGLTKFRLQKFDGTTWVFITEELTFNPHRNSGWQVYRIEEQEIQQIRVYMTGSGNPPFTHFAEFEVYALKN